MMELGFLQRLRVSPLWERVGAIIGTSAGALVGWMAAAGKLADVEPFLYELRPEETFRANRLWRLPLLGTHDYVLPQTIAERLGDTVEISRLVLESPVELVVVVTDVTAEADGEVADPLFERAYSSRQTTPEELAQAVLASAAISALVLPVEVGDRIGTDGGWVRNYPLGYAYDREEVELIVAFRFLPRYPVLGAAPLRAAATRLRRYSRLPPARRLLAELEAAVARDARGVPAHIADIFSRLTRVAIIRNTQLEVLVATWREQSVGELRSLRADVIELVEREGSGELAAAVEERFATAKFPFRHDRDVPRITVAGGAGELTLDPGFRNPKPWSEEAKRALVRRGWQLTDEALRRAGYES
jgi:predicted acylesterase/phospholipase RssA